MIRNFEVVLTGPTHVSELDVLYKAVDTSCDFLVVGGGIVGLAIANAIKAEWPDADVILLEKESNSTSHASGRNSGVLHAGFYYSPESLKARLTRDGNRQLKEFCVARGIPVRHTGKVVVATNQNQLKQLDDLYSRGMENGVDLQMITEGELHKIEPLARTFERALWSPSTSVADPKRVTEEFARSAEERGVKVLYGTTYIGRIDDGIVSSSGVIKAKHFVNCAGLFADRVASDFGFCDDYVMLPFTGLYAYAPSLKGQLNAHVYPVPDPKNPFLGVHATVTVDGQVKIGPTAIPALSRQAYRAVRDLNPSDLIEIIRTYPKFLTSPHHQVGRLIATELPKYSRSWLVHEARKLVPSLRRADFTVKGKPGIRAQLFDLKKKKLEMDFIIRGNAESTHILNAVSPAWTSSIAVADYVKEDIKRRISLLN
jgi:L-2-hydroxyglutarate oxidase LhgO